jgi:hypothetical protein
MRFNARLDKSHHGPQHPFKEAGVAADSLTAIHNAMLKLLYGVYTRIICVSRRGEGGGHERAFIYLLIGHNRCN